MADCHRLFLQFHDAIDLAKSHRKSLRVSRNALRQEIRDYMKANLSSETQPLFYGQGSFAMRTCVAPIPIGEKLPYDLDDGVYFPVSPDERKSPPTYHKWICDAVAGHTQESVRDKNACVRVSVV